MLDDLTCEILKEHIHYDPNTGNFTRAKAVRGGKNCKVGDVAGGINGRGYWVIRILGKKYQAHRLAYLYMTGEWPKEEIDHRKRNKADNRWHMIRSSSRQLNNQNQGLRTDNSSGIRGVHRVLSGNWKAEIMFDSKRYVLGTYADIEYAALARYDAEVKYNFPEPKESTAYLFLISKGWYEEEEKETA